MNTEQVKEEQFHRDMGILKESIRKAYGPWTRKERMDRKLGDIVVWLVDLCFVGGFLLSFFILVVIAYRVLLCK